MGKRERILVCSGGATGPDGPWFKGEDKLVKWKISSAVLQGIDCKWLLNLSHPKIFSLCMVLLALLPAGAQQRPAAAPGTGN